MKYYSEITKKLYENELELKEAEEKEKEAEEKRQIEIEAAKEKQRILKEEHAKRKKEVEEAYRIANVAKKDADNLLYNFLSDYGETQSAFKSINLVSILTDLFESLLSN